MRGGKRGRGRGGGRRGGGSGGGSSRGSSRNHHSPLPFEVNSLTKGNCQVKGGQFTAVVVHPETSTIIFAEDNVLRVKGGDFSTQQTITLEGRVTAMRLAGPVLFIGMSLVIPGETAVEVGVIKAMNLGGDMASTFLSAGPTRKYSHKRRVNVLECANIGGNNVLFSGAEDGSMAAWFTNPSGVWACKELEGHVRAVTGLQWACGRLYSCSYDGTICVWNMETADPSLPSQKIMPNIHQHVDGKGNTVGFVGLDFWSADDGSTGRPPQNFLFSAAQDGVIKVWDLRNPDEPSILPNLEAPRVPLSSGDQFSYTLTCIKLLQPPNHPTPLVACGYSNGKVELRTTSSQLKESVHVRWSNSKSQEAHFRDVSGFVQIYTVPQADNPSGATPAFVSFGRDHTFQVWNIGDLK